MSHPATPRVALTRRQFVTRISRFGTAAVLGSLFGLDLLARDRGGFRLPGRPPSGRVRRVVVLGGAAAGLAVAYELGKLGYECTLLEARTRPGGRVWTVRRGTEETEIGHPTQRCGFDPGLFYNAGAMRLSHHHQTTIDYCREFGIRLVPFPSFNEAAFVHVDGQARMRIRELDADLRGHLGELLAKVIDRGQLDAPFTKQDGEKLIEYLRAEGRLDARGRYPRSGDTSIDPTYLDHPRGYTVSAGNDDGPGRPTSPLELEALVRAGYLSFHPYDHELNEQGTMLTPADGMDQIPLAFAKRLSPVIRYGAEVRQIRRNGEGVRVTYADLATGATERVVEADYCVCTLPPHLAARLPSDLSAEVIAALKKGRGELAGKVGLQFKRRFWEEDDDIYGGRSLTTLPISQIYYPFDGLGAPGKGIVIGAYHMADPQRIFADRTPAERERLALEQGEKVHPQYRAEFECSFAVEWARVRYSEGSWIAWDDPEDYRLMQRVLTKPDGPVYFAGDWLSPITGWQAGAFVSAHRAVRDLHARATA